MHLLHHNYLQWFGAYGVFQGLAITCHKHGANWGNTNELKADTGKRHSESAYVTMSLCLLSLWRDAREERPLELRALVYLGKMFKQDQQG